LGLKKRNEVELIVSLNDLKKLQKNDTLEKFELVPLIDQKKTVDPKYLSEIKQQLFNDLPFYEGLLFNKESGSIRCAIYINKKVINSPIRKEFILNVLVPEVAKFEKETNIDLKDSEMPYER
jgi:hypothetical protein